jgi:hypothetical protein
VKIACIQHYNNSTYLYFDLDLIFHYAKITLLQKSEMKPTGGTLSDAVLFDKSSSF